MVWVGSVGGVKRAKSGFEMSEENLGNCGLGVEREISYLIDPKSVKH